RACAPSLRRRPTPGWRPRSRPGLWARGLRTAPPATCLRASDLEALVIMLRAPISSAGPHGLFAATFLAVWATAAPAVTASPTPLASLSPSFYALLLPGT